MLTWKHSNQIIAVVMGAAVVGVGILLVWTQVFGFVSTGTHAPYESAFFHHDRVDTVNVEVADEDWNNLLENALQEEYVPCTITLNGTTLSNVGIRAKGNTSLTQVANDSTTDRYSFKVEFDHYITGQSYLGLDKLALNNIISDATYMKEYLSYQVMEEMGIAVPLYGFVNITVNGEPWGVYMALECLEESYAQRNFGSEYGELYKPESQEAGGGMGNREEGDAPGQPEGRGGGFGGGMNSTSGGSALVYTDDSLTSYADIFDHSVFSSTDADQARVVTALKHLNEGTDLENYIDVDEVLRYFAANTVLVNLDSYVGQNKHNYYLYESGGRLSILPWDFNLAFGGFSSGDATAAVNHPIDTPVSSGIEMEDRPLIGKLLEVEEYKEKYHQYLQEIVTNYFDSGKFEATIAKLDSLLSSYIKNDATAFYTDEEYQAAIQELKKFGTLRAESIQGQLDGSIPSTWEGQQADASALLDASSVNLQAMGSMGGGMGQMGSRGENGGKGLPAPTAPAEDEPTTADFPTGGIR